MEGSHGEFQDSKRFNLATGQKPWLVLRPPELQLAAVFRIRFWLPGV